MNKKFMERAECLSCMTSLRTDIKELRDNELFHVKEDILATKKDIIDLHRDVLEILTILKGRPADRTDTGVVGDIQILNRDRKILMGVVVILLVPFLFLVIKYLFGI